MLLSALILAVFCLAVAGWAPAAAAQDFRDFVFRDEEGHMVLRFVGFGPDGLDFDQMDEVINVSLSTMVHDRLRADDLFESEPVDAEWAESMEPLIHSRLTAAGDAFSIIDVHCRSATCRLVLELSHGLNVPAHQVIMGSVQTALEALIEDDAASFEPGFMLAGYSQERETPSIKAFLRRGVR